MTTFSNPRKQATIENWPHGRRGRVTAVFEVESNQRGERVKRTTTGKPKATTYHREMVIVDGDNGRTYAIGKNDFDSFSIIPGTLKGSEYVSKSEYPERFEQLNQLFGREI